MANEYPEDSTFENDIEVILTTDSVQGDPSGFTGAVTGKINIVLNHIINRTRWLKDKLEALDVTVPNATTTTRGIAELATKEEAEALDDTTRITTPKRVADILKHENAQATESQRGTAQIASQAEAEAGSDNTRIMTPERSLQQLRHSNAEADTSQRGTVQRATQDEVNDGTDEVKYVAPNVLQQFVSDNKGFIRTQYVPSASNAKDNVGYIETNADDVALRIKVKSSRKTPFFFVTVEDLGNGHHGYAVDGYSSLGSGLAVNAGGSVGYSGLGAVSERFVNIASSTFTRVGTYTIARATHGFASDGTNLYYLNALTSGVQIVGVNPTNGSNIHTSSAHSPSSHARGLAILNGIAYWVDTSDNHFYSYDIANTQFTALSSITLSHESRGLATLNNTLYVMYLNSNQAYIAEVDLANNSVINAHRLTGFNANDNERQVQSFTGFNNHLYIGTDDTDSSDPYLYTVNPSTGALTEVGAISPANADFFNYASIGNYIYAFNADDRGVYRAQNVQGNRWEVLFPTTSTEVTDDDTTLQLFTSPGSEVIELIRQTDISDAIAFASDYDSSSAHTVSVGDNLSLALYNGNNEQLYEGSNEPVFSTIALTEAAIGT